MDQLEAKHNDVGGIAGIVSDDSFVINCYSTVEKITANSSYASVVGYSKKGNLQNIYGNSAVGVAVGRAKNTGSNVPSVWPTQPSRALSLGEMMSGSVSVPSNGFAVVVLNRTIERGLAVKFSLGRISVQIDFCGEVVRTTAQT